MKNKIVKILSSTTVIVLCRFILGGIFIYASIDKIVHSYKFAEIIYNYRLLPDIFIYLSAIILPWLELITGLFLVSGIYSRTAAIILSSLLVIFMIALGINALKGININCGCFSTSSDSSNPITMIIRDIFMLLPGIIVIFFYKDRERKKVN